MNKTIQAILFAILALPCSAQIPVTFLIDVSKNQQPISPFLFGVNAANGLDDSNDMDMNVEVRRQGGNRLTGYNWENNASNAGQDSKHSNDNWLISISGIQDDKSEEPGILMTAMHEKSLAMKCQSVVTIPMAGFVAADKNGEVTVEETAPSARWKMVKPFKRKNFSLKPDVSDDAVYTDEMVHFLVTKFGMANTSKGIQFYALDNEPALWRSTHPRLHPAKPTCKEMFTKSIEFSAAVKSVDKYAQILGGVFYGYSEHNNMQNASDWYQIKKGYTSYTEAFLDKMKKASDSVGYRLVDILDFHWYPEATGVNNEGKSERICEGGGNDEKVAYARMQAPRSLWDTTYVEKSWITQDNKAIALLPMLKKSIDAFNPGTKIALTEFDYGGGDHISGGIAMTDAFGIFATNGVYMANYWKETTGYAAAAFRIFRNYDNKKSTWGDVLVKSTTSDIVNSSVYASYSKSDSTVIHLVLINKNPKESIKGEFKLNTSGNIKEGTAYQFTSDNPEIKKKGLVASFETNNSFVYTLPPLSVTHLVLKKK
jgi:mannan endo-1,4-beta-mannosidase